jgi:competence protein ComEA
MNNSKSHFRFSKKQRNEILFLLTLVIVAQIIYFNIDFKNEAVIDMESLEVVELQRQIDSLKDIASSSRQPERRKFNPNFITDYSGFTLGMSPVEIDRLHKFRAEGKWVNSVADFKKVTLVSDSLLGEISPYFQFPDWVTNPRPTSQRRSFNTEKPFEQKIDLNKATAEELKQVNGIGEVLSQRIIQYRNRLNGFVVDEQLYDVFGLEHAVVRRILNDFTVKEKPEITKFNINKASASDMATLPFISFNLAREIVDYRMLHEGFKDLEELKNVEGFPVQKFERFALYLTLE